MNCPRCNGLMIPMANHSGYSCPNCGKIVKIEKK